MTMASASSAAAATPEPAPQVRPQQGLLTVRDMIQGASVCVLVALLLVVMSTLAIGGGLKVNEAMAWGCGGTAWCPTRAGLLTVSAGCNAHNKPQQSSRSSQAPACAIVPLMAGAAAALSVCLISTARSTVLLPNSLLSTTQPLSTLLLFSLPAAAVSDELAAVHPHKAMSTPCSHVTSCPRAAAVLLNHLCRCGTTCRVCMRKE